MSGDELFSPKPFGSTTSSYRKVSSHFESNDMNSLSVQTSSLSQSSRNSSSPISSPMSSSISSPDHLLGPFTARSNTSGPPSPSRYFASMQFQPQTSPVAPQERHVHPQERHVHPQERHVHPQERPGAPVPPPKPAAPPAPLPKPRQINQMNISQAFAALSPTFNGTTDRAGHDNNGHCKRLFLRPVFPESWTCEIDACAFQPHLRRSRTPDRRRKRQP
jgi:hypothetical protein